MNFGAGSRNNKSIIRLEDLDIYSWNTETSEKLGNIKKIGLRRRGRRMRV